LNKDEYVEVRGWQDELSGALAMKGVDGRRMNIVDGRRVKVVDGKKM